MRISHFAVTHPAIIGMLLIALCAFGVYSFFGLNIEFMGDISLPTVEVISIYPGSGAYDVEHDVTDILEEEFVTLPDFKAIDSSSYDSFSWITITFRDKVDPYDMLPEIRDRIRRLQESLPDGLQGEPTAIVGGATMLPVFIFSVEGGQDIGNLTSYLNQEVVPLITQIPGVANVTIEGAGQLELQITLHVEKLQATNISVLQVQQALSVSNVRLPVGKGLWQGKRTDVRFDGSFESIQDIASLPIGADQNGAVIRLEDVASVRLGYVDNGYYVDSNGQSLVTISVTKRSDGNTLNIVRAIKQVITEIEQRTDHAISCTILSDDSRNIGTALRTVITSGLLGVLMAVITIFLFLRDPRSTLIIFVSIPLSILFTLIGMRLVGLSVNLLSLSGIVVALGMVVDGSIVMLEQVFRHLSKNNDEIQQSIIAGADEVGGAIVASTTTTLAVFLPIALLGGIVGLIIRDVGVTLILALLASLLVAITVVPFLTNIVYKRFRTVRHKRSLASKPMAVLEHRYKTLLVKALAYPRFVITGAIGILALTVFAVSMLGFTFLPSTDNGDFYIDIEFARGTTLDETRVKARQGEALVRSLVSEIESVILYSGQSSGYGFSSAENAYMKVVLVDRAKRERSVHEIMLLLQQELSTTIPGARINITNGGYDKLLAFVSGGGGYALTLAGENLEQLHGYASQIEQVLTNDQDVVSVRLDTDFDSETLIIDAVHDVMGSVGVSPYEAALTTAVLFRGIDIGTFYTSQGERYDIKLKSDIADTPLTQEAFASISIPTVTKESVSLADIAQVRLERSVSQINHSERAKTITISATLVSEDASGVYGRMNEYVASHPLPSGIKVKSGGIIELIGDSLGPLIWALAIGIFLVYTVMVIQFERFRQPLIVMVSIPFCLIGVVIGLLLFGSTISLLAAVGVISLGGIVVNNAIILIDYINQLRTRYGEERHDRQTQLAILKTSIIEGSASRIQPILMTSLTTIFGVAPMALSAGTGSEIYAPLGQAIVGGLLTSMLITLVLVPVLYNSVEQRRIIKRTQKNEVNSHGGSES